jgi:hypothetical protein
MGIDLRPVHWTSLLSLNDEELARVDPLVMNLLVAKGIPKLEELCIGDYVATVDAWVADLAKQIPGHEAEFVKSPQDWKNDHALFKLGLISWYLDIVLGIAYKEDQRELKTIKYTNPNDLFLNGIIDTHRGTCGNMAALYVAMAWRLGWPVSLACAGHHLIARYEDGCTTHNIEATNTGLGGFSTPPDQYYIDEYYLPEKALTCGSDLKFLTPREMLGVFVGLRARHFDNTGHQPETERDYLLARYLFPNNRILHRGQINSSLEQSLERFEPQEDGSPESLLVWLQCVYDPAVMRKKINRIKAREVHHANAADTLLEAWTSQ